MTRPVIQRPLPVGKRDRFQVGGPNLLAWSNGEDIISFTVELNETRATLSGVPTLDEPGRIGFYLDGVSAGRCLVHVNYETATRTGCASVYVMVINC